MTKANLELKNNKNLKKLSEIDEFRTYKIAGNNNSILLVYSPGGFAQEEISIQEAKDWIEEYIEEDGTGCQAKAFALKIGLEMLQIEGDEDDGTE